MHLIQLPRTRTADLLERKFLPLYATDLINVSLDELVSQAISWPEYQNENGILDIVTMKK
jgi:hypothetical protein